MKQKLLNLRFLLFVNLFSLAGYYIFVPLYAVFAAQFSISPKTISLIWGLYSLATACLILVFGRFENHKSKGKMAVFGYFIYALGALSFLLVHNERMLVVVLLFNALGAGITLPAYKAMFARNNLKGRESEQWSWLDAGNMVAAALGASIGGLVIGEFGFRGLFIAMATVQFIAALVAFKTFYRTT